MTSPVASPPPDPAGTVPGARADSPWSVLRQRDLRLLCAGLLISNTGTRVQQLAQNWLLWELTHSAWALGIYGLFRTVPFLLVSLYAGVLADRFDRRRLLVWSNGVSMIYPLVLGLLVALGRAEPWHIYLMAFLSATADSFDNPARQALIPTLVPRAQLMSALSVMNGLRRIATLIGPSLGGLIVLWIGTAGAFYVNGLSYGAVVIAALLMRAPPPVPSGVPTRAWTMVREGLDYVRQHEILSTLLAVETAVTLCTSYQSIMPVFADDVLGVGPAGLGLLMTAPGLGAVVGSIVLVSRGDVQAKGRWLLVSGGLFGVAMLAFALSHDFLLSLAALVVVGCMDAVYAAVRNTIVQMAAPEAFRGRVISVQTITQRGLSPSGNFVTGSLAAVIGAPFAVAVLGVVTTALVLWRGFAMPALRDYRDDGGR
jgi:MFS family permease